MHQFITCIVRTFELDTVKIKKDKIDRYVMMDIRLSSGVKPSRLVEEMRCVRQNKCDSDVWWQLHEPLSGVQPVNV